MLKQVLLILLASYLLSVQASSDRIYMSPMEQSSWVLTADTALRCEIEHQIPRFGKAVFFQQSGRPLEMKIVSNHNYKKDLELSFRSVTANWKGEQTEAELGRFKSSGGNNPLLSIDNNPARQAYFELQQGYQPSLFFVDDEDGFNSVSVILSTVRFRDVEADFGNCLSRLYPYHFDDIKSAQVHFEFDDEFPLQEEEDRALGKMLAYLKLDDSVKSLVISGHADFKGSECYNETLSARRAWYVYDFLVQNDVDPRLLQVEFYGETKPVNKGKDELSRAANRRVTVTMVK
jgi:outer membrane protein OmpA-like peptidoglycan-associated protein